MKIHGGRQIQPGTIAADQLLDTAWGKGDLLVVLADGTFARLAAGTDGHVLTADSSTTSGLAWAEGGTTPPPSTGGTYSATYEGTY